MPYADPEQIVKSWLITHVFPGVGEDRVRVFTGEVIPAELNVQHSQRLVRILQISSSPGDAVVTLDIADLEINCYARTRNRVRDLANQVRVSMRYQLERSTDPDTGAFVKQVRWLASPAQVPSESSGFQRRMATCRLWIHHDPLG